MSSKKLPEPGYLDPSYLIKRAARQFGEIGAFESAGHRRTFTELVTRAEGLATALLGRGLRPGDRVAILGYNCLEYVEIDLALILAGLVRVPLNARLSVREWEFVLEDSESRLLFLDPRIPHAPELEVLDIETIWLPHDGGRSSVYDRMVETNVGFSRLPHLEPGAPCWLLYTSGTTGRPKGVMLSRRAILEVGWNLLLEFKCFGPGTESILTQPLSHGSGYFVLPLLLSGSSCSIMPSFDVGWLAERILSRPTGLLKLVPVMLQDLVEELGGREGFDVHTIVYGAAPIPRPTLEAALALFGPRLAQIYGQTEAPATLTCLRPEDHARDGPHLGSAGRPWHTVDLRIVNAGWEEVAPGEVGEIIVSGAHLMTGYWGQPQLTEQILVDGWLRTRDIGRIDDQGYVYLMGRTDEMINSGGFSVAPKEIEEVLNRHPAVVESVVVGVPHRRWGQQIQAVVRTVPEAALSQDELIEFARPELGFRRPRRVVFVERIPRNAYGKVDRGSVMELLLHTGTPESGTGTGRGTNPMQNEAQ